MTVNNLVGVAAGDSRGGSFAVIARSKGGDHSTYANYTMTPVVFDGQLIWKGPTDSIESLGSGRWIAGNAIAFLGNSGDYIDALPLAISEMAHNAGNSPRFNRRKRLHCREQVRSGNTSNTAHIDRIEKK